MKEWAHVITSFRGQWLPGDPRGFRDHGHRIHSSGDYKHPPPEREHAHLHRYAMNVSKGPVFLNSTQASQLGPALLEKIGRMEIPCDTLVVTRTHVHALLRVGRQDAVELFGRVKQFASHRLRNELPGKVWGASSQVVRIRDLEHLEHVHRYITEHPHLWMYNSTQDPRLRQASASPPTQADNDQ